MSKLLLCSNSGIPDGFGRIADEIGIRLAKRGVQILGASYTYDGLLPAMHEGTPLPYHVAGLSGKDANSVIMQLINVFQPDAVLCIQDFPYLEGVRYAPVDWSKHAFIGITPVDGTPIYSRWIDLAKIADALLTISQFGVEAFRQQGVTVGLCRPGVDGNVFYPTTMPEKAELRAKLGLPKGAFVLGTAAMNQGRKAISTMIECFFEFAKDKPHARYLLDMDKASAAGWEVSGMLCKPNGWDESKLLFREDCLRAGLFHLRQRYAVMDAHAVLAHREGYGLPLVEAQACGVVSIAMDYSSGREICGDGKGVLVKPIDYFEYGTWGGARDFFPDKKDFVAQLQRLHDHPAERASIAQKGMEWARSAPWDAAADAVHATLERVLLMRLLQSPAATVTMAPAPSAPAASPDGVAKVDTPAPLIVQS